MRLALVTSLIAGGLSVATGAANPDPNALRAKAQADLAAVTVDVDRANIMYSPADNGVGANFAKIVQYQQEYMAGRQNFDDGKYAEALQLLSKADQIIRSQSIGLKLSSPPLVPAFSWHRIVLPTQQPEAPAPDFRR
jgi:hypothetical protein